MGHENENQNFGNMEIGEEQPPLDPKKVQVLDIEEREVKDIGRKLVLKVKHPDNPEMEISKVKYEKNQKITESGLWLTKDKDDKIPYNSALAYLLRFYNVKTCFGLKGKEINTALDKNGFIVAKAY